MTPRPDINAWSNPAFVRIIPETDAGETWCFEHINAYPENGAYQAQPRVGDTIVRLAQSAGLTVALDGHVLAKPEFLACTSCPDGRICKTLGECFALSREEGRA